MSEPDANEPPTGAPARKGFASLGSDYRPPSLEEVQALVPRDEVLGFIGHGGMGTYYLGRQASLDRLMAIKVLLVDPCEDAQLIEGFKREAKEMAGLNHGNIIKVFDFGEADSKLFLLMEYVKGQTLEYVMGRTYLELDQVVAIMLQVCNALEHAHSMGVTHLDLRLGNTMVDENGTIKVGDFGLARLIGEELFRKNLIEENKAMGTMSYVAPEQHEQGGEVDYRADIYSLGVMLYKMTTGKLPETEFKLPTEHSTRLPAILDEMVIRCLQREPEKRYQSIAEIRSMVSLLVQR